MLCENPKLGISINDDVIAKIALFSRDDDSINAKQSTKKKATKKLNVRSYAWHKISISRVTNAICCTFDFHWSQNKLITASITFDRHWLMAQKITWCSSTQPEIEFPLNFLPICIAKWNSDEQMSKTSGQNKKKTNNFIIFPYLCNCFLIARSSHLQFVCVTFVLIQKPYFGEKFTPSSVRVLFFAFEMK